MTVPVAIYLSNLRTAYQDWISKLSYKERGGIGKRRRYIEIQSMYLLSCVEIIEHFYSKHDYETDNFMTVEEIMELMTAANHIMGTGLAIEENLRSLDFGFTYSSDQCKMNFKLPSTSVLIVDWGDNEDPVTYRGNDTNTVTLESDYSTGAAYTVKIYGDYEDITYFDIGDQTTLSRDIETILRFSGLTYLDISNTSITGSINPISARAMTHINCNGTAITGSLSAFYDMQNTLEFLALNGTSVTGEYTGLVYVAAALEHLDLGDTSTEGVVTTWGTAGQGGCVMKYIDLLGTTCSGTITDWGTKQTFLEYIAIEDITADISGWTGITNLEHLDITGTLSGSIAGFSALTSLNYLKVVGACTGDISGFSALTELTHLQVDTTTCSGSINGWSTLTKLVTIYGGGSCTLTGNLNVLRAASSLVEIYFHFGDITWTDQSAHSLQSGDKLWAWNCLWSSTDVDNCLIALYNGASTGAEIKIAGNNAARTSASDTAYTWLTTTGGCTVEVN